MQRPAAMTTRGWLDELISVSARLAEGNSGRVPPNDYSTQHSSLIQRIVVVEDDELSRDAILTVVRAEGLSLPIESASDVESASRLLRNGGTALVITDLGLPLKRGQLPKMDGGIRLLRLA